MRSTEEDGEEEKVGGEERRGAGGRPGGESANDRMDAATQCLQ